jgi:hypothetical protein
MAIHEKKPCARCGNPSEGGPQGLISRYDKRELIPSQFFCRKCASVLFRIRHPETIRQIRAALEMPNWYPPGHFDEGPPDWPPPLDSWDKNIDLCVINDEWPLPPDD